MFNPKEEKKIAKQPAKSTSTERSFIPQPKRMHLKRTKKEITFWINYSSSTTMCCCFNFLFIRVTHTRHHFLSFKIALYPFDVRIVITQIVVYPSIFFLSFVFNFFCKFSSMEMITKTDTRREKLHLARQTALSSKDDHITNTFLQRTSPKLLLFFVKFAGNSRI